MLLVTQICLKDFEIKKKISSYISLLIYSNIISLFFPIIIILALDKIYRNASSIHISCFIIYAGYAYR